MVGARMTLKKPWQLRRRRRGGAELAARCPSPMRSPGNKLSPASQKAHQRTGRWDLHRI
jgi:hypothetical protein